MTCWMAPLSDLSWQPVIGGAGALGGAAATGPAAAENSSATSDSSRTGWSRRDDLPTGASSRFASQVREGGAIGTPTDACGPDTNTLKRTRYSPLDGATRGCIAT